MTPAGLVIATPFSGLERPFFEAWVENLRALRFDRARTLLIWLDNSRDPEFGEMLVSAAERLREQGLRVHLCADPRAPLSVQPDSSEKSAHVGRMWDHIREELKRLRCMTAESRVLCLESDVLPMPHCLDRMQWWLDVLPTAGAISAMVPYRPADHEAVYPMCWNLHWERMFPEGDGCHDLTPQLRIIGPMRRGMTRVDMTGFGCLLLPWAVFEALSLTGQNGLSYDHHAGIEIRGFGHSYWLDWESRCRHAKAEGRTFRTLVVPGLMLAEEAPLQSRAYETSIGKIDLTTDCAALHWIFESRARRHEAPGHIRVDLHWANSEQIQALVADYQAADRTDCQVMRVLDSAFVARPGELLGLLHHRSVNLGRVIEWVWLALPALFPPPGFSPIHASAVSDDEGATILVGESGSGKTHQARTMIAQGHRLLSDDLVLINPERRVARGWDGTLHLVPQVGGDESPAAALDSAGKMRIAPDAVEPEIERSVSRIVFLSEHRNISLRHAGDGLGLFRPQDRITDEYLRAEAECVGLRPSDPSQVDRISLRGLRVALANRDPEGAEWNGFGGDMVQLYGYMEAFRHAGIDTDFVPAAEVDPTRYDLIYLLHSQFPWARELVARGLQGTPMILFPITHGRPARDSWDSVVRAAAKVLCYSPSEAAFYCEHMPEAAWKLRAVPMGLSADMLAAPVLAEPADPPRVFMAGRYCSYKNQLSVLRACRQLDVPVIFAGPTDHPEYVTYRAMLEDEARGWGKATFHDLLRGPDLWREYQSAWVHANASQFGPYEQVSLEALHFRCNIMHTRESWAAEEFGRHGTLCDPADVSSIAQALTFELNQPRGRHGYHPPSWIEASIPVLRIIQEVLAR